VIESDVCCDGLGRDWHKQTYRGACYFVRFRGKADVHGRVASAASVANDPEPT
jgi:hypothetical protein